MAKTLSATRIDWGGMAWPTFGLAANAVQTVASSLAGGLLLVSLFLLLRSVSGAFRQPLGTAVAATAWIGLYVSVLVTRVPAIIQQASRGARRLSVTECLGTAALIGLSLAISLHAGRLYLSAIVPLVSLVAETSWYAWRFPLPRRVESEGSGGSERGPNGSDDFPRPERNDTDVSAATLPEDSEELTERWGEEEEPVLLADGVERQLTRELLPDDKVRLHGLVRGRLSARERVRPVHVEFCPPFAADPRVTAYILQGDPVDVRTTQAACFGGRWEWHRPASAAGEAVEVVMFFEAIGEAD